MSLAAGEAGSLWHALSLVPDNRRAEGKRYPRRDLAARFPDEPLSRAYHDLDGSNRPARVCSGRRPHVHTATPMVLVGTDEPCVGMRSHVRPNGWRRHDMKTN